jgi:hypothetical protein
MIALVRGFFKEDFLLIKHLNFLKTTKKAHLNEK